MTDGFNVLLRRLRQQSGWTQDELAQRAKISDRTVRRLERDTRGNPQLVTVRLLADALELAPADRARLLAAAGGAEQAEQAGETSRHPVSAFDRRLAEAAGDLANTVAARARREVELRRLTDPVALPVRWRAAPEELTDHWANIRRMAVGGATEPLDLAGRLDEVVAVYRRIPSGRLVVLGEAGAGKTMLAIRFVLDLLGARAPEDPVPVVFGLGAWDPTRTGLRDWLAGQLVRDHPGLAATGPDGATLAAALVDADRILPVLDGFDEIAPGLHRAALQALNATTLPLLLTSRPHQYAKAVARTDVLTAAAGVTLTDLTVDDLAGYLPRTTRKAQGWDTVLTALREHPHSPASVNLRAVLTTPLMVGLARAIYSDNPGLDPSVLLDTDRFGTREAVEDHLLASFVDTAYRDERARRWLRYLARHADRLGGARDLAWWQLGTTMRVRARAVVIGVVAGLAAGLIDFVLESALSGVVAGLASAIMVGLIAGPAFGLAHALVARSAGVVLRPARVRLRLTGPRRIGARIRYGLAGGFLVGAGYGLLRDVALTWVFGGRSEPVGVLWDVVLFGAGFAAGAGLAAGLVGVFEGPLDVEAVVSPADLLRISRTTVVVQLLVFGSVFTLVVDLGLWLSVQLLQLVQPFGMTFIWNPLFGLVLGIVGGIGGGLGYALSLTAWGQWAVLARLWLPLTGRLPWALTAFLDDACRRGVLRQAGAAHQFRHARLKDHLTGTDLR